MSSADNWDDEVQSGSYVMLRHGTIIERQSIGLYE
jgi:hypothetical protein